MPSLRVAVDVGGTFTDIFIMDEKSGSIRIEKTASTPDPIDGIHRWRGEGRGRSRRRGAVLPRHDRRHQRADHAPAAAHRDGLHRGLPRRHRDPPRHKEDLWDAYKDVAQPYIPRRDRLEVTERVDAAGQVLKPLDEAEAREVARILKRRDVAAVAVCFINAYANGANEQRMAEILQEALPDVPVSTSSEVLPEIFEHERFSTTVANAVLTPLVVDYVRRLGQRLAGGRLRRRPAAPALRRRRDDPEERRGFRRAARRVRHRRRRDRQPPHRHAVRLPERDRRSTWAAPAPTSRSSTTASRASPRSGSSSTAIRSASRRSRC